VLRTSTSSVSGLTGTGSLHAGLRGSLVRLVGALRGQSRDGAAGSLAMATSDAVTQFPARAVDFAVGQSDMCRSRVRFRSLEFVESLPTYSLSAYDPVRYQHRFGGFPRLKQRSSQATTANAIITKITSTLLNSILTRYNARCYLFLPCCRRWMPCWLVPSLSSSGAIRSKSKPKSLSMWLRVCGKRGFRRARSAVQG